MNNHCRQNGKLFMSILSIKKITVEFGFIGLNGFLGLGMLRTSFQFTISKMAIQSINPYNPKNPNSDYVRPFFATALSAAGVVMMIVAINGCYTCPCEYEKCGEWRWNVKTLSDTDADKVNMEIQQSTIKEQWQMKRHFKVTENSPRDTSEEQLYKITGKLIYYKLEEDLDLHLVLVDGPKDYYFMVAELPSVNCYQTRNSKYLNEYKSAREVLSSILLKHGINDPMFNNPDLLLENDPIYINVYGVGFWDKPHDAFGSARNDRELHPVLRIEEKH